MNEYQYHGARWWRFDFHTHTPASNDFMSGVKESERKRITPEYWLQKFMEKGIDCVAVTDHNSGAWIDKLKDALSTIEEEQPKPDWYRPLVIFPGVEISAQGGVHILAIFDPNKTTNDIAALLGAVGYRGKHGDTDQVTESSVTEVIDAIEKEGVAIPAHADTEKGLFGALAGLDIKAVLGKSNIHAMELVDINYPMPKCYQDMKTRWTVVRGSDTHNFRDRRFGHFAWVKMDSPSLEGLKLALLDGTASVRLAMDSNPRRHSDNIIESLEVAEAQYVGKGETLRVEWSPFLNTLIGGRGTGKSTLLEFMRLVLRRKDELADPIKDDKYYSADDDGLLTERSLLRLTYRKQDTRYRLNWSPNAAESSLEIYEQSDWKPAPGEIRSLFPARIYSQKQILELAQRPQALLNIIDEDPAVEYVVYQKQHDELVRQYKQLRQEEQRVREDLGRRDKLQGELNDLAKQIEKIEASGHKAVLTTYRQRKSQLSAIEHIEQEWEAMSASLSTAMEGIDSAPINQEIFASHPDILTALGQHNNRWSSVKKTLQSALEQSQAIINGWQQSKQTAAWFTELRNDISRYEQIKSQLLQQGIDPDHYPNLLQLHNAKQAELLKLQETEQSIGKLHSEADALYSEIKANRQALTTRRQKFLQAVLKDDSMVDVVIEPFKEPLGAIKEQIRSILQCPDRFDKDIEALMNEHQGDYEKIRERIMRIKERKEGARDSRFQPHLENLPIESFLDLELYFPEDKVVITFGDDRRKLQQGSPGQKSAALLTFILSYGVEPLLLDQPEDDLDNSLIYNLVVKHIRSTKSKRQIIIVTHNANIVVNGDSEMVHPLLVDEGQTRINLSGSIQKQDIRNRICDILEGGQQAFTERYKRIHLEE